MLAWGKFNDMPELKEGLFHSFHAGNFRHAFSSHFIDSLFLVILVATLPEISAINF